MQFVAVVSTVNIITVEIKTKSSGWLVIRTFSHLEIFESEAPNDVTIYFTKFRLKYNLYEQFVNLMFNELSVVEFVMLISA